jgi:hypothetical protein
MYYHLAPVHLFIKKQKDDPSADNFIPYRDGYLMGAGSRILQRYKILITRTGILLRPIIILNSLMHSPNTRMRRS